MSKLAANPVPAYLIDASIYIFQAHFSPYVECQSKSGEELSALYGFTQFLLQFLRRVKPERIAVAQDESLFCGFRHDLSPDYKSNRELPDENLAWQLEGCAKVCELLGLQTFSSRVYEADDIIGTLATRMRDGWPNCELTIVSRDKDLAQLLIGENDCLWDYSGNHKRFAAEILEDFGVRPDQIPDYLGLVGDSVDCISGVPGIGPVKAVQMLSSFETMEGVYLNLEKLADLPLRGAKRLPKILEEHKQAAELSKILATIVCDVDEPGEMFSHIDIDQLRSRQFNQEDFAAFLRDYGFTQGDADHLIATARGVEQQQNR